MAIDARRNPTKLKKTHNKRPLRFSDGMQNLISGIGTARDRQKHSRYVRDRVLTYDEVEEIHRNQWVSKAIDGKPFDMTREGRTFKSDDLTPEELTTIKETEEQLNMQQAIRQALTWASLYGGAAIVMVTEGAGKLDEPLNLDTFPQGGLLKLAPVDRWHITWSGAVDYNPISLTFGEPEFYRIAMDTENTQIHRSRVIRFTGREMPYNIQRELLFWGDSDIQRWYDSMIKYDTTSLAIGTMVHDANLDILKLKDLAVTLTQKDGEQKILDRLNTLNEGKSVINAMAIDAEDDLTRNPISFSALPEIEKFKLQTLAGALDYPLRRLLGESTGGLGAVDDGSTRDYYDAIGALQKTVLAPRLRRIDQVMVRSALGKYPDNLSFKFNSLWKMTEKEEADLNAVKAETLNKLADIGVPEHVLMRDAVEQGLTNNLDEKYIAEIEKNPTPEPENENEFSPFKDEDKGL